MQALPGTQEPPLLTLPQHLETGLEERVVQEQQEVPPEPTGGQLRLYTLLRSGPEQRTVVAHKWGLLETGAELWDSGLQNEKRI